MKFSIEVVKGVCRLVAGDGRAWILPENIACVCFDADGEIWAYENREVNLDGDTWQDLSIGGLVTKVGYVSPNELTEDIWKTPLLAPVTGHGKIKEVMDVMEIINPVVIPKADGRKLRGLVIDSVTRDIERCELGAREVLGIIRDLDSATFNDYTTLRLVIAFSLAGYDLRNTGVMKAFESIDGKVNEAWEK